jgi:hypothetical protein
MGKVITKDETSDSHLAFEVRNQDGDVPRNRTEPPRTCSKAWIKEFSHRALTARLLRE